MKYQAITQIWLSPWCCLVVLLMEVVGRKEMFYLTTHSTHFIYGYMASDIWLRTFLIVRKETRCHHIGYSFRLAARVLLYAPSHRQDSTYHSLCYTNCGALAGTRNSPMKDRSDDPSHHEPTLLPQSYILLHGSSNAKFFFYSTWSVGFMGRAQKQTR